MKKPTRLDGRGRKKAAAFSLIEVTIAIAITAVGLVALMGMLPQGLETMRRATDKAVEARIHQQILGELLLTNWENRFEYDYRSGDGNLRYYDDQGIETGQGTQEQVYTARIHVPKQGSALPVSIDDGLSYPGMVFPNQVEDPNVQLVIVEVTSVVDESFDFDDPDYKKAIRTFHSTIAKMGYDFDPDAGADE